MEAAFQELELLLPIRKSKSGKDVTPSARALYNYLEVKTPFTTWLTRRVEEYGFVDGKDFLTILEESTGGRPESDAALTVDMAKELGMVEKTPKGRIVRQYFIWAENKLKEVATAPRPALPANYREALAALLSEVEEKERIEQQLALAAPKLAFMAQIEASTNALSFSAAAKWLKIPGLEGRNKLIARLKADKILMADREPYQQYIDAGYFEVEPQTYQPGRKAEKGSKGTRLANSTRVTPKGLEWLQKRYR